MPRSETFKPTGEQEITPGKERPNGRRFSPWPGHLPEGLAVAFLFDPEASIAHANRGSHVIVKSCEDSLEDKTPRGRVEYYLFRPDKEVRRVTVDLFFPNRLSRLGAKALGHEPMVQLSFDQDVVEDRDELREVLSIEPMTSVSRPVRQSSAV